MPTAIQYRERAADAQARTEEILSRMESGEGPPSDEDNQALVAAMSDVAENERLAAEADERARSVVESRSRLEQARAQQRGPARPMDRSIVNAFDGRPMPHTDPNNTCNGRHEYSLVRGMYHATMIARDPYHQADGLEGETHQELRATKPTGVQGFLLPWNAPLARKRAADTTTWAGTIQTTVMGTLIDLLRPKLALARLGARVLTGLDGPFNMPKKTSAPTAAWVAEGASLTPAQAAIGNVAWTPKTVGASTEITRKLLIASSSNFDIQEMVEDDLTDAIAQAVEIAAINGSGSGAQPLGILQRGGSVNSIAMGTNGGPLTWKVLNQVIGKVEGSNAPADKRGWLINPTTLAWMGGTPREAGQPKYLWDADNPGFPIAAYRAETTTNLPSNLTKGSGTNLSALIYGNWAEMIIAMFSGIDVVVNPYSLDLSGGIRITAFQDCDVNLRYPEAFCFISDLTTV